MKNLPDWLNWLIVVSLGLVVFFAFPWFFFLMGKYGQWVFEILNER